MISAYWNMINTYHCSWVLHYFSKVWRLDNCDGLLRQKIWRTSLSIGMLKHVYRFLHLTSLSWSQTLQTTKRVLSVNMQCCWPTNSIYTCTSLTVSHPVMASEIWHVSHGMIIQFLAERLTRYMHGNHIIFQLPCWESVLATPVKQNTQWPYCVE